LARNYTLLNYYYYYTDRPGPRAINVGCRNGCPQVFALWVPGVRRCRTPARERQRERERRERERVREREREGKREREGGRGRVDQEQNCIPCMHVLVCVCPV